MALYAICREGLKNRGVSKETFQIFDSGAKPISLTTDFSTLGNAHGEQYIFAADAVPKAIYYCLECGSPVQLRKGKQRMAHFYHIRKSSRCSLYHKCSDHLLLQLQLQKFLPQNQIAIERPFPSIHRIGDLVWEKEKIVFEIQCSKIDGSEAKLRIADYGKIGYTVIWLLDDRIFNKSLVRPAEAFLRENSLCYFFSFTQVGLSHFYDQLELISHHKRKQKGFPLKIDLSKPRKIPNLEWSEKLPLQILERTKKLNSYFEGDLIHRSLQSGASFSTLAAWREKENAQQTSKPPLHSMLVLLKRWIKDPYLALLDGLLKTVSLKNFF